MSYAAPKIFTKDEATAAQRTFGVWLSLSANGLKAEDIGDLAVKVSKAGAALGAAAGAITQYAAKGGYYKVVLDAADVSAIGDLLVEVTGTGVDTLRVSHQVSVLDLNVATAIADDGLTAAKLAADAGTELRTGLATSAQVDAITLATRTVVKSLGSLIADGPTPGISMLDAIDAAVTVTGTWDGSTVTIETCEYPAATVPVWTAYDDGGGPNPLTANGTVTVTGPHNAVRAKMSNDGAASNVAVSVSIRKPANT